MARTNQEELFNARLDHALKDDQTRRSLADAQTRRSAVDREADPRDVASAELRVRTKVLAGRDAILRETDAYRAEWSDATDRYHEAEALTAPEHRRVFYGKLWALATGALIGAALAVLAIAAHNTFVAASLIPTIAFAGLPWIRASQQLALLRRELRIAQRDRDRVAARRRYVTVLGHEVTAATRRAINAELESFDLAVGVLDDRGLRDLSDPEREVQTSATTQLRTLMASITSGSIGLSGPRGCGKTTVIRSFATGRSLLAMRRERRGLVVSAPVRYDAREFLLHLFASVCERVLHPVGPPPAPASLSSQLRLSRMRSLVGSLCAVGTVAGATGLTMLLTHRTAPQGPEETGGLLIVLGAGTLYIAALGMTGRFVAKLAARRRGGIVKRVDSQESDDNPDPAPPGVNHAREAERQLEDIRFQQSLASGWTGTLGLPLGVKLGGDSKLTLTRTPWTLPEVVDRFCAYVATLADDHYLVVGIDELDKMESDEAARRFINDIKGVFGVRGCYYLVSVSEEAMSSFERRGLPFRDVFDSSFDAIMRIGYLTLEESREVLQSRVVGLPVPHQCLCHCLAGGLPRDLVRAARELVHQWKQRSEDPSRAGESIQLAELTAAIVATELRGKVAAAMVAARAASGPGREWLLEWILRLDDEPDAEQLQASYQELRAWRGLCGGADESDGARRLREIAVELTTFSYYACTVLEYFGADGARLTKSLVGTTSPGQLSPEANSALAALARARQQFSASPGLAAAEVAKFRRLTSLAPWRPVREDVKEAPDPSSAALLEP